MGRKVFGVGINDADYNVYITENVNGKSKVTWRCPVYICWIEMLRRCYSEKFLIKNPTYIKVKVCKEWLTFSNFKCWYDQEDKGEGWSLDKDLLGSGELYSPNTCIFLPRRLNTFISLSDRGRYDMPIGVSWNRSKTRYWARCTSYKGERLDLGYYDNPLQAHRIWQKQKLKSLSEYIEEFRNYPKVYAKLVEIYKKLSLEYLNCLETHKLL